MAKKMKDMSLEELETLSAKISAVILAKRKEATAQAVGSKLKTYDDFEDKLTDFMTEAWDQDEEEGFVNALLALVDKNNQGPARMFLTDVMETAGTASNARSELESISDEDPDYEEIEASATENYEAAIGKLKRFWSELVKR